MTTKFWTAQTVQIQTALGAAKTLSAISKASNGQCTVQTVGDLPTAGAFLLLEVAGMRQLHRRVVKVSSPTGSTFNIGIDTSAFDTFVSGTFKVITFGSAFSSLREPQSSGGDPVFEDTTTIHDVDDTQAIVGSGAQSYSFSSDWDTTDAALIEANKAFVTRTPRAIRMVDPDSSEFMFYAYVSAPLQPTVSGKKKVTPVSFSLVATGTAY